MSHEINFRSRLVGRDIVCEMEEAPGRWADILTVNLAGAVSIRDAVNGSIREWVKAHCEDRKLMNGQKLVESTKATEVVNGDR